MRMYGRVHWCMNGKRIKMLLLLVIQVIAYVTFAYADFLCVCNYNQVLPVYPVMNATFARIGSLGQNECKPIYKSSSTNWLSIQYHKRVGFVLHNPQTKLMACSDKPNATDTVEEAHFLNCQWVNSHDCSIYAQSSDTQECGSNRITYDNRCLFAKARCKDLTLHILHDGACLSPGATPGNPYHIHGGDAVFDFFCKAMSHRNCTNTDVGFVCGTDGYTYSNFCEYEKVRCTDRNLHVANFGHCP